jgi:hypothetical protein
LQKKSLTAKTADIFLKVMEATLKYGKDHLTLSLPEKARISILQPSQLPLLENLEEAFDRAMNAPLGGVPLEAMTVPRTVAIAADMDPAVLQKCHLRACDPQKIVERLVADFNGKPSLAVIPNANTTYFYQP